MRRRLQCEKTWGVFTVRCVRLNRIGEQCRDQTLEGRRLCSYHSRILEDHDPDRRLEALAGSRISRFPVVYRLATIALLLIFLYAAFQTALRWLGR